MTAALASARNRPRASITAPRQCFHGLSIGLGKPARLITQADQADDLIPPPEWDTQK